MGSEDYDPRPLEFDLFRYLTAKLVQDTSLSMHLDPHFTNSFWFKRQSWPICEQDACIISMIFVPTSIKGHWIFSN